MVKVSDLVSKFEVQEPLKSSKPSSLNPKVFINPRSSLDPFIPKLDETDLRSKFVSPDDEIKKPVRNKSGILDESKLVEKQKERSLKKTERRSEILKIRMSKDFSSSSNMPVKTELIIASSKHYDTVVASDSTYSEKELRTGQATEKRMFKFEIPLEHFEKPHSEPLSGLKAKMDEFLDTPTKLPEKSDSPQKSKLGSPFAANHRAKESKSSFESLASFNSDQRRSMQTMNTPATDLDASPAGKFQQDKTPDGTFFDALAEPSTTQDNETEVPARSEKRKAKEKESVTDDAESEILPLNLSGGSHHREQTVESKPHYSISSYCVTLPNLQENIPTKTPISTAASLHYPKLTSTPLRTSTVKKLQSSSSGLMINESNDSNVWNGVLSFQSRRKFAGAKDRLSFTDDFEVPETSRDVKHPYTQIVQPARSFRQSDTFCQPPKVEEEEELWSQLKVTNESSRRDLGIVNEKTGKKSGLGHKRERSAGLRSIDKWLRKIGSFFSRRTSSSGKRNPDLPSKPILASATSIPFTLPPMVPSRPALDSKPNSYSMFVEQLVKAGVAISPREYLKFLEKNLEDHEWQQYLLQFLAYIEKRFAMLSEEDVRQKVEQCR